MALTESYDVSANYDSNIYSVNAAKDSNELADLKTQGEPCKIALICQRRTQKF